MKLSLLMCTYNGSKYIVDQLLSILEQSRQPDEVVIIDDLSLDNTVEIATNFIKDNSLSDTWKIYVNECNKGWIRNFIDGIEKTTFESLFGSASSDNFGDNASGFMSRFAQFSGVVWLAQNGSLLIGFGANCHMRNLVYYFQQGEWQNVRSFDVNYLADIIQYGIIGALGYLILYVYVLLFVFRRSRGYMTNTNCAFVLFYALYYAVLFASAGLGTTFWLVTGLMIAYNKVNPTIFIRDGKFKKVFYIKEHFIGNQLLLL